VVQNRVSRHLDDDGSLVKNMSKRLTLDRMLKPTDNSARATSLSAIPTLSSPTTLIAQPPPATVPTINHVSLIFKTTLEPDALTTLTPRGPRSKKPHEFPRNYQTNHNPRTYTIINVFTYL